MFTDHTGDIKCRASDVYQAGTWRVSTSVRADGAGRASGGHVGATPDADEAFAAVRALVDGVRHLVSSDPLERMGTDLGPAGTGMSSVELDIVDAVSYETLRRTLKNDLKPWL